MLARRVPADRRAYGEIGKAPTQQRIGADPSTPIFGSGHRSMIVRQEAS